MSKYVIGGIVSAGVEVEIEGVPPCLYCGDPVTSPSMDGPLVCSDCDCGYNHDGTRWTDAQYRERRRHFDDAVEKYRELAKQIARARSW